MSKLFQATIVQNSQKVVNPATTVYLNTKRVVAAVTTPYTNASGDAATGTLCTYAAFDGTQIESYIFSEATSTINTRMNAANTTDVYRLGMTEIVVDPQGTPTVTQQGVNVDDIWLVQAHPLNSAQSLVVVDDVTRANRRVMRVSAAASAIAASANA